MFPVSGVCNGVSQGSHDIGYGVGACEGNNGVSDALTGWGSSFHIFVEELRFDMLHTCGSTNPVACDEPLAP